MLRETVVWQSLKFKISETQYCERLAQMPTYDFFAVRVRATGTAWYIASVNLVTCSDRLDPRRAHLKI